MNLVRRAARLAREALRIENQRLAADLLDGVMAKRQPVCGMRPTQGVVSEENTDPDLCACLECRCARQRTICAGCGENKSTPLRRDDMDGYVCLTCIDKRLSAQNTEIARLRAEIKRAANAAFTEESKEFIVALTYDATEHESMYAKTAADAAVEFARKCDALRPDDFMHDDPNLREPMMVTVDGVEDYKVLARAEDAPLSILTEAARESYPSDTRLTAWRFWAVPVADDE